jgi:hypothetical protein
MILHIATANGGDLGSLKEKIRGRFQSEVELTPRWRPFDKLRRLSEQAQGYKEERTV